MRRCFRIYRCPCNCDCEAWRWECTLCRPPARGVRYGPGAWQRIVAISLPHHFRCRWQHHWWGAEPALWPGDDPLRPGAFVR